MVQFRQGLVPPFECRRGMTNALLQNLLQEGICCKSQSRNVGYALLRLRWFRLRSTTTATASICLVTSASLRPPYFGFAQHITSTNSAVAKHKTGFWKWPSFILVKKAIHAIAFFVYPSFRAVRIFLHTRPYRHSHRGNADNRSCRACCKLCPARGTAGS
jgi:hypothetical protein